MIQRTEGKDFQIIKHPHDKEHSAIQILEGPYKNVKFSYGKVNFQYDEEKEDEPPRVSFNFDILKVPLNLDEKTLYYKSKFKDEVIYILDTLLYSKETKIGNLNTEEKNNEQIS